MNNDYSSNIFEYSNRSYTCMVTLYTREQDPSNELRMACDGSDIEEIVYEGKFNDLVLTGHITYVDKYANVDKMINQHYCYCEILFALNKNGVDNSVNHISIDENNRFVHQFIVNGIKVIAREASIVKYQIDIVSVNWFKCIANVQYSNYGKNPEPLFDIVKNCISQNQLTIDDETFNSVKTIVSMNYITQMNDNLFTVMKYLFHKLYYNFDIKDDSMKFFVYDWFNDKYRLLDMKLKNTVIGTYSTVLSFFKTNNEVLIQQEPTNIGSFKSPTAKTSVYSNLFNVNMFQYFHDFNTISSFQTTTDETVNYLNNKIDNGNYEQKYKAMFQMPSLNHQYYGSYWNSNVDQYDTAVDCLTENNSLILNITGEIRRQPGTYTMIGIDRSLTNMTNESKRELEKLKLKYKAFEGIWMASKVRNIISPKYKSFRQLVVLFRNFIPTLNKLQS